MLILSDLYRAMFKRLRGRGFGWGLFDRFHGAVWERFLQPDHVEVNGYRLYLPRRDEGVSDSLRMDGRYEPEMTAEFRRRVAPGMTVVDVGANIGYYTLLASRLAGPRGRVLAFEPDPANFRLLSRNIDENRCGNVEAYPYAAGRALGYADLLLCRSNPGAHSLSVAPSQAAPARRVVTVALDDFLGPSSPADVVKIDVEGYETEVLRGMTRTLEASGPRLKTIFIECNPSLLSQRGLSADDVLAPLCRRGWTRSWMNPLNALCVRP